MTTPLIRLNLELARALGLETHGLIEFTLKCEPRQVPTIVAHYFASPDLPQSLTEVVKTIRMVPAP